MAKRPDIHPQTSSISQAVERYKRESVRDTKELKDLASRIEKADMQRDIQESIVQGTGYTAEEVAQAKYSINKINTRQKNLQLEQASAVSSRYSLLQEQLSASVMRHIDPRSTSQEIGGRTMDLSIKQQSMYRAQTTSQSKLLRRSGAANIALGRVHEQIQDVLGSETIDEPELARLEKLERARSGLINKQALYKSSLSAQRRLGISDDDILMRAQGTLLRGARGQETSIRDMVASGHTGSLSEEKSKNKDIFDKLAASYTKAAEMVDRSSEEYENLIGSIKEQEKALSNSTKTISEMRKQGRIFGGGGHNALDEMKKYGQDAAKIGAGIGAIGSGYRDWTVNYQAIRKQAQTGYAQLELERYNEAVAASGGNSLAALNVLGGVRYKAQSFGAENMNDEERARLMEMGGGLLNTVGSTVSAGSAGAITEAASSAMKGRDPRIGAVIGAFRGGANEFIGGASKFSTQLSQYRAGAANLVDIDMQNRYINLENIKNTAKAQQIDAYKAQYTTIGEGLRGVGAGYEVSAEAMIRERGMLQHLPDSVKAGMLQDIQGLGKKATRISNLDTTGQRDEAMFAMMRGQSMYRAGTLGSARDYTQMLGQMAQVGGDTRSLETAIKTAFTASLESSLNIKQIVSGITSIASSTSQSLGVDTTLGAATSMSRILADSRMQNVDPNLRAAMAAQSSQAFENSSVDMSLGNVFVMGQYSKLGLNGLEALAGQRATKQDFESIDALIGGAAEDQKKGLTGFKNLAGGAFSKLLTGKDDAANIQIVKQLTPKLARIEEMGAAQDYGALHTGTMSSKAQFEYIEKGTISDIDKSNLNLLTAVAGKGNFGSAALYGKGGPSSAITKADQLQFMPTEEEMKRNMSLSRTSAQFAGGLESSTFTRESEAGEASLQKMGLNIDKWAETLEKIATSVDLKQLAEAPRIAAENMTTAAKDFGKQLSTFNTSIQKAADALDRASRALQTNSVELKPAKDHVTNNNAPGAVKRGGY